MRVRRGLVSFIVVIQSVLFLTHFLLYETWTFAPAAGHARDSAWVGLTLAVLSVSFVAASLLAFRYTNAALRAFYKAAAVWVGLLTFLVVAAASSWIIYGVGEIAGLHVNFHRIVEVLFAVAVAAGLYGGFNAGWTRVKQNHGSPREPAGGLARAKSGADQRCPSRPRAKRQVSTASGCDDLEGRARRDI